MSYLLDTNVAIALLRDRPVEVRRRFRNALAEGVGISTSSIVLYELWHGVARSQRQRENAERLQLFLSGDIAVVPFEAEDAAIAGELRAGLEAQGMRIGPYDLLIAAQAIRTGAILVSANVGEFSRVPDLRWQDWTRPA
jgi:tRNA(fMet)-specific endonuclease VapC